jgi:hypothetical protein
MLDAIYEVTTHIFDLKDAKGLLKAGVDAFAHSVRDKDIDEEGLAMFKQHPNRSSIQTFRIEAWRWT